MVVIGGGVIGLEMGSVYSRLGTEVTVVEYMDRLCPTMDLELTKAFKRVLEKQGMKFMLKQKVTGGQGSQKGCKVNIESVEDPSKKEEINCDIILVSTGRRPFTNNLQLDKAGLVTDKFGRIDINEHF